MQRFSIVIHGGAGTILKEDMTPELEKAYINGLEEAIHAGYAVLEEGGAAVNAVKAALVVLEDNLLFNAGRGSVWRNELPDAQPAFGDGFCDAGLVSAGVHAGRARSDAARRRI